MKRLLFLLVPVALSAQVEIDTVIRLPSFLQQGFFISEHNKLYVEGSDQYYVLDCSTYQVKSQIPRPYSMGLAHYSYDWRRRKLYVSVNPYPDSTLVIDAAADSVIGWSVVSVDDHWDLYVSDIDRRYKSIGDTLYGFECAADTVVQRILPPTPGAGFGRTSWDSVGHKIYAGMSTLENSLQLAVYDYVADSLVKLIDVSSIPAWALDAIVFDNTHRRAYLGPYQPEMGSVNVGIIDTERDTLVGVLPVRIWNGLYTQVAVDERDGKVYLADNDADPTTPDTLWVVDGATDSVLKKVVYEQKGWGACVVRWVPWSNRIYIGRICDTDNQDIDSSIVVLDCNTDSIIVPALQVGRWQPADIQLDPIRERIFVIGADTGTIHVLRDTGYGGVAEGKRLEPRPSSGLRVQMVPSGFEIRYSVTSACRVELSVYDLMGREVRRLVAEGQLTGQHAVVWNCQDLHGNRAARGVYFVRLDTPGFRSVKKAVVAR